MNIIIVGNTTTVVIIKSAMNPRASVAALCSAKPSSAIGGQSSSTPVDQVFVTKAEERSKQVIGDEKREGGYIERERERERKYCWLGSLGLSSSCLG